MNVQVQFLSFLKIIYSDVVNLPEEEINQIIKILILILVHKKKNIILLFLCAQVWSLPEFTGFCLWV